MARNGRSRRKLLKLLKSQRACSNNREEVQVQQSKNRFAKRPSGVCRRPSGLPQERQIGEPAAKTRRVWLKDGSNRRLYTVFVKPDTIGDDLRRAATPDFNDRKRMFVTLRKADGAVLDLEEPVPADVGVRGASAVVVEVAPAAAVELTTESARQRVEEGVRSKVYKAPELPEGYYGPPLHREEASKTVASYINGVRFKTNTGMDGKFPLLGCSGMKGIGKTALLVHGARVLVPARLAQDPPVKAVYLTFNGGGAHKEEFVESLSRPGCETKFANAFGHMLMAACGVERDVAQLLDFDDCLSVCRSLLHLDGDATAVFFVDEVGDLKEQCLPTLSALMAQMDKMQGKLAFVFAHIRQEVLDAQQTESGREVIALPLPALPISVWKTLRHDWAKAAAEHPGLHQLLLACCGHPRALVDGLPAALKDVPNLLTTPTEEALIMARESIRRKCKFNDVTDVTKQHIEDIARRWFDFVEPMKTKDLARDGLLITVAGKGEAPAVQLLHPLVVQHWAHQQCETSAMAFHLQQAYAADAVVGPDAEKKMEAIMYHYEAVLRLAVAGKVFVLRDFYLTCHVDPAWGAQRVRAQIPESKNLVVPLPDFSDLDNVLEHLRQGFIVVSEAHGEIGIEYLSPFVDAESEELIVAAVQCKFVNTSTEWGKIESKVLTAVKGLKTKAVRHFPVVYTTVDQETMFKSTFAGGVYFIESDLFAFTRKLGILRLHVTKLGHILEGRYPWLRRADTAVVQLEALTPVRSTFLGLAN